MIRPLIGYVPDFFGAYEDMVVQEYLEFFASAYNITGKQRSRVVGDVLELTDLESKRAALVDSLSRGMQQRLSIARVLLHDPKVLILDEPTSGLDPNQILEIRSLIKERSKDKTVILSTHIMQEVQSLCDRVVIINQGKLVADQGVAELKAGSLKQKLVTIEIAEEFDTDGLLQIEGITDVTPLGRGKYLITGSMEKDIRPLIFKFATEHQLTLKELKEEEHSLEHIFHELTNN